METMVILEEATNILKVETHMRDTLEAKIRELSGLLDDGSNQELSKQNEADFLDVD